MIAGFTGFVGSGKTYSMVERALRFRGKRTIVSNMGLGWAEELEDLSQIPDLECCLLMLDELGVVMNSRRWNKVGDDVLDFFAQHRKRGVDVLWTCQSWENVDSQMRRATHHYAHCRKFGEIVIHEFKHGGETNGKRIHWGWTRIRPEVYSEYDTYTEIGRDGGRKLGAAALESYRVKAHGAYVREVSEVSSAMVSYRKATVDDVLAGEELFRPGGLWSLVSKAGVANS